MSESLLIFLFLLLGIGLLIVPFTARAGLGSVIGYLLGGVLIGPFGFALVKNGEEILHLAEFGVVLLLFLIGLELNPKRLWKLRRSIFGMGFLQIALSIVALLPLLMIFGWAWQEALVASMGFAMSSTAIAMQIMGERGLMRHEIGQTGFSILLFQDIAVVPILLIASLLKPESGVQAGFDSLKILTAIGAIALIIVGGRYLNRPIFRWIAGSKVRELSIAFSLLIVVAISWLMMKVGLSMALGAFLAGVILAESEYRHELEANIEPFKGLLLGLFFLAVGMSINLQLIWQQIGTISLFVLSLVLAKILVIAIIAKVFGMQSRDRWLLALILSQGGEFAFVLFTQALKESVLQKHNADLLTAVVSLSMLSTPLLLLLYEVWSKRQSLGAEKPAADAMPEDKHPVIIAGFGRVGQIVSRLLRLNGIMSTVIDHSPTHIENVRRFGNKAYYGDATQLPLLEAAGIRDAKLVVLAMDDRTTVSELAKKIKELYPKLPILVRAFDRTHVYELYDHGIEHMERETFGSALNMGRQALELMGVHPHKAWRIAEQFQIYDRNNLKKLHAYRGDDKLFISKSREAREQLEQQFIQDAMKLGLNVAGDEWDQDAEEKA